MDTPHIQKMQKMREKEEEDLVSILSEKYGIGYINLTKTAIMTDALRLVPEHEARASEIAAFKKIHKKLFLAVRTPLSPETKKSVEELESRGYSVEIFMVSSRSLSYAWELYKDISFAVETEAGVLDISNEEVRKLLEELTTLTSTKKALLEVMDMKKMYRITRILEIVIAGAIGNKASDIHIEPEENTIRIRFRIDGVLIEVLTLDPETYKAVLTRVKLLSGLKINIHDASQDGRFSIHIDMKEIEIRTSLLPGNYGESIVLRLLDPSSIDHSLEKLGFRPALLSLIEKEIHRPNGMILTTGPTGSGKTTTLYAMLSTVVSGGNKVLTIEDPVEYHLEGITQTQVNHDDYTFSSGLRSALRQDPDIIMVGEIRDEEVARTAVHAALTGHMVFSTLHTNNASGAYPRLIDIGIDASMVGSSVSIVIAQRLLRKLHPEWRKKVPTTEDEKIFIEETLSELRKRKNQQSANIPLKAPDFLFVPDAPEGEVGYKGRIGVYEAILTTREIEDVIRKNLTTREIEDEAKKQDSFLSMKEDAVLKVIEGITTIEEIHRVLGMR